MNSDAEPKVICIGWHKTGTSSIGDAMLALGYDVLGARVDLADKLLSGTVAAALAEAVPYTALQDVPWNALYKELDRSFPGSKFILTIRDEENWLKSAVRHFGEREYETPIFRWLYGKGRISGNEECFRERYRLHNQDVREYFANRPDDLLVLNLEENPGWTPLCEFLSKSEPSVAFPHSNPSPDSLGLVRRLRKLLAKKTPMPLRRMRLVMLEKVGRQVKIDRFNNRKENAAARARYVSKPKK